MKRMLLLSILILVLTTLKSQPPCSQDSLTDHTPITVEMDTVAPPCWQFCDSTIDSCHYVELRDSFSGVFELSNADEFFEIVVLDRCRWVVHDTCAVVTATTPGFVLFNTFPPISTVMICGQGNSSLQVTCKHVPSANFPPFGPPTLDLDTSCGPFVGMVKPIEAGGKIPRYFDKYTLERVYEPQPNTYYLKREND